MNNMQKQWSKNMLRQKAMKRALDLCAKGDETGAINLAVKFQFRIYRIEEGWETAWPNGEATHRKIVPTSKLPWRTEGEVCPRFPPEVKGIINEVPTMSLGPPSRGNKG